MFSGYPKFKRGNLREGSSWGADTNNIRARNSCDSLPFFSSFTMIIVRPITTERRYMNTITELLNLEDSDIYISDIKIEGTKKIITVETHPSIHFCPQCDFRMHSRGVKQRKINHPILQDTYECVLLLKQRRWKCTNPLCNYSFNESFNFVGKRKRNTNATLRLFSIKPSQRTLFNFGNPS